MKKLLYLLLVTAFLSCNNERVLELPKIESAEITEVLDVSHAYIFYDETQPDSTLFNRKNLIGTTNWLVNVDKRLTLKQAIPHIQYLQDKRKKASMHKNEAAKNYFTCNDTSIKNLGFVEFTEIVYLNDDESVEDNTNELCHLIVHNMNEIQIISLNNIIYEADQQDLKEVLFNAYKNDDGLKNLLLIFSEDLSFQDYIRLKSLLIPFKENTSNYELVFQP
ncbi:hypothetical protein [Winogradskyella sp.]|uniref:hypothetical protein n=1 Tax=Winogradskyella sp. TaxID=1883156 RepID=UPI003AA96C51